METAKLFFNGRSQAIRLPKAFRLEGNEVYIKKKLGRGALDFNGSIFPGCLGEESYEV